MTPNSEQQGDIDKHTRVEFRYNEAEDYKVVHGSGAYGGINGQANITFDIYTEYQPPPETEEKRIKGKKLVDVPKEDEEDGKAVVNRTKQIGVVMTLEEAKSFVDWLQGKVNDLEQQKDLYSSEGA